jgi:hypothetical protein
MMSIQVHALLVDRTYIVHKNSGGIDAIIILLNIHSLYYIKIQMSEWFWKHESCGYFVIWELIQSLI